MQCVNKPLSRCPSLAAVLFILASVSCGLLVLLVADLAVRSSREVA